MAVKQFTYEDPHDLADYGFDFSLKETQNPSECQAAMELGWEMAETKIKCHYTNTGPFSSIGCMYPIRTVNREVIDRIINSFPKLRVVYAWINDDWIQVQIMRKGPG